MKIDLFKLRMAKIGGAMLSSITRRALLRYYVLAAVEHAPVVRQDYQSLVDIGANKGQFSLVFRAHNPSAKIFAFEPLVDAASTFRRVFSNDSLTTLFEVAVGADTGVSNIYVSRKADSSSMLPIGSLQTNYFPGTDQTHVHRVKVVKLPDLLQASDIPRPSLLKIDVQGFELSVLNGCAGMLSVFDAIYCECSFIALYDGQALAHEVIEFLNGRGFFLTGIFCPSYAQDGSPIQADFLFRRVS